MQVSSQIKIILRRGMNTKVGFLPLQNPPDGHKKRQTKSEMTSRMSCDLGFVLSAK